MDCGRMRFNDELIGTLTVSKMTGADCIEKPVLTNKLNVRMTVMASQQCESHHEWLTFIRANIKALEDSRMARKNAIEQMETNLEYHEAWLKKRFKTI